VASLLVDTDVTVDFLRGMPSSVAFFEAHLAEIGFSVITHSELFAGARSVAERTELSQFLSQFEIFSVTGPIARTAGELKYTEYQKRGIGLADCLIAATAIAAKRTVVSLNKKHFTGLVDLLVPYKKR
jgi:predicted nucleic acid-binding protein